MNDSKLLWLFLGYLAGLAVAVCAVRIAIAVCDREQSESDAEQDDRRFLAEREN